MSQITAKFLRFTINLFIIRKRFYLLGMVFIRLARKLREKNYKTTSKSEFVVVNNCMSNIKMNLDKNSYMGGSIYWSGYHHVNEMLYLRSFLSEEMTFVDVGANQGEFTLFAANILKKGKVISFEPVSFQYDLLIKNMELNKFENIELNKFGLSNEVCQMPIYNSTDTELHAGFHEGLSTLYKSNERNNFQELIELKVFDDIFYDRLERFDFLKIDIEGAELFALKGMTKSLEKYKPDLLIEISEECYNSAGYSIQDLIDFLSKFDYIAYKLYRGKLIKHNGDFSVWGNYIFKSNNKK